MAISKKKTTTAIVAGVAAAALVLGGTFAWTSISQRALNEAAGVVNVGGRLHDDFNGTNKDIYVENFTDPLNGGQPIYARVKLTEYMEVGQDAGGYGVDVNNDGRVVANPVIDGTDINNMDGWKVFVPGVITGNEITCADCAEEGNTDCTIHDHWKWTVGGQTTFMPTFNKDKDSLEADINGTYAGTNPDDKVYYDDYVVYTTDENGEGVGKDIAEDNKETYNGSIYSVVGTEYYDDDPDSERNDHDQNTGTFRTEENVTHTAKQTGNATVMTMEEWLQNPVAGNFWVYDKDGWAYWANPIMPGESTGLLLDGIEMYKNPGEKCYYSINVVAEFATVGDWEYFTDLNETDNANALEVLKAASGNVTTVTVTNNGATTLKAGETTNFTATATKASDNVAAAAEEAFTWAVYDAELKPVTTSTIENGVLTVGENELNENLIIAAKHTESGAVGLASVAVVMEYTVEIDTIAENDTVAYGSPYTYRAIVKVNGVEKELPATWSVSGNTDNATTISNGVLTLGENETAKTLTIRATAEKDSEAYDEMTVKVVEMVEALRSIASITAGSPNTVAFDNNDWYVLAKEDGKALLWAAEAAKDGGEELKRSFDTKRNSIWRESQIRSYLNGDFLQVIPTLSQYVRETTLKTAAKYDHTVDEKTGSPYIETEDKVFLLSYADIFGAYENNEYYATFISKTEEWEYTYGGKQLVLPNMTVSEKGETWLRSIGPDKKEFYIDCIYFKDEKYVAGMTDAFSSDNYIRPAMWVDLEKGSEELTYKDISWDAIRVDTHDYKMSMTRGTRNTLSGIVEGHEGVDGDVIFSLTFKELTSNGLYQSTSTAVLQDDKLIVTVDHNEPNSTLNLIFNCSGNPQINEHEVKVTVEITDPIAGGEDAAG